jgi:hypothetical protein
MKWWLLITLTEITFIITLLNNILRYKLGKLEFEHLDNKFDQNDTSLIIIEYPSIKTAPLSIPKQINKQKHLFIYSFINNKKTTTTKKKKIYE